MALYKIDKDAQGQPTGDLDLIAGGTLYADAPIGTIFPFLSSSIPAGFLLCDGTAYSATDYPELWAILPSTVKNTTNNTFTIDLRETTLKGAGLTGETVGAHLDADGLSVGEFIDDRVQNFTLKSGDVQTYSGAGHDRGIVAGGSVDKSLGNFTSSATGATTEVKSRGVNFIIKAKMVAVPADFMSAVDEAIDENAKSPISVSNKLITESDLPKQFVTGRGEARFDIVMDALGLSGYPNRFAYEVFGSTSNKCYAKGIIYRDNSSVSCNIFGYIFKCFIATNNSGTIAVYDEAKTTQFSDAIMVFTRIN